MLREIFPPDTATAFLAMRQLRTSFEDCEQFVRQVDDQQRPGGYRLVGSFADAGSDIDTSPALAVTGFRVATSLSWGHHIYVDDLSTLPTARGQGHATALLAWINDEATRLECCQVHLDSGVGPNRYAAHRLYLNSGYVINAHHFLRTASSS